MRIKKELQDYIDYNIKALLSSERDFKAIYEIMFRDNGLILAETEIDYRIRRYSYAEVKGYIENASAFLFSKTGATHGYVALEMENCLEWIVAFWAILKSGNRPFLVNCRHPLSLSRSILDTLGIKTIIGMKETKLKGDFIDFSEFDLTDDSYPKCPEDVFENEFAISTSATSLHQSICFYTGAETSRQILDAESIVKESPRMATGYNGAIKQLAFLPFYHVFGLFAVYFWFAFFGRTFVFLKNYSPDTIVRTCRRHEVTHIFAVPALWHTIEKKALAEINRRPARKRRMFRNGIKFCTALQNIFPYAGTNIAKFIMGEVTDSIFGPSIVFCISGGSYLKESALKMFNGIGYPLHNGYGMSEIGITSVELRPLPKQRNLNSVGHPIGSIEYKVSDHGTLLVKGESLSKKIMIDGVMQERGEWFDTMDIASSDKDYWFIKGREKDLVIGDNGENINPDMVEQLFEIPHARNFSCYGETRSDGEVLAMVVRIDNNATSEETDEIYEYVNRINGTLPQTSRIRKFYFTYDPLMSEQAIKVSRAYLKRGIENGDIRLMKMKEFVPKETKQLPPADPEILSKVTEIIADVLGTPADQIRPDANIILDLGASSLQYFEVLSRITDMFGAETFSCNTAIELSKYIEDQKV